MRRLLILAALVASAAGCGDKAGAGPVDDRTAEPQRDAAVAPVHDGGEPDATSDDSQSGLDAAVTQKDAGVAMDASAAHQDAAQGGGDSDGGVEEAPVVPGLQFNGATTIVRWEP